MKTKTFSLIAGLAIASHASAAYTFVDATTSNTTLDGAALVPTNPGPGNYTLDADQGTSDDLWAERIGGDYAGGFLFESDAGTFAGDRENTGNLITSVTLAAVGTYNLIVIFDINNNRDIAAKVGSNPTTADYFKSGTPGVVRADTLTYDATFTNIRGANAGAASLGQITTTVPNQVVAFHINGFALTTDNVDTRTRYDGVAYELIPEPSTALLGALGALALLRRRRN